MRELELVLEVGERAQAADDHARAAPPAVLDQQALEGVDLDAAGRAPSASVIMARRSAIENSGVLAHVLGQRDDHAVEDLQRRGAGCRRGRS